MRDKRSQISALDAALNLLGYCARTEKELRVRLEQKGYDAAEVDAAVAKLLELRYLDDDDYASKFAETKMRCLHKGERAIRAQMRSKGLDARTIESAMNALDPELEYNAAKAYLQKLTRQAGQSGVAHETRKLYGRLAARGFSYEVIRKALGSELENED